MGDVGFYVPYADPIATAEAIKMALQAPPTLGSRARARIIDLFPEKRREDGLQQAINGVLSTMIIEGLYLCSVISWRCLNLHKSRRGLLDHFLAQG